MTRVLPCFSAVLISCEENRDFGDSATFLVSFGCIFTAHAHCVADMWKDHIEKLYNSKNDSKYRSVLEHKLLDTLPAHGGPTISVTDIYNTLSNQNVKKHQDQTDYTWRPTCLLDPDCMFY